MKRLVLGLAAVAAGFALFAPSAWAHGGQYRGPGGAVPPGLREPSDPTPPPPPPPTTQPPPTTTGDPGTPPPPVTTPNVPPPTTGPTTPLDGGPGTGRKSPTSFDQWVFWWNNNNDDILHIKESIYRLGGTGGGGLTEFDKDSSNRTNATRATEKEVKETLIPGLLWAMDHSNKQHPDTESAAYIALAKVSDDPEHIKMLKNGVYETATGHENKVVDQIVRESAALSLGLLRRKDANRQFDAKELDAVRDFLFTAFDDESLATRTRCFAALSIGLLGDQPTTRATLPTTGGGGILYAPEATTGAPTSERLWELIHRKYSNEDLLVCSMVALSLQDPRTIKLDWLDELSNTALKGKLGKENASDTVASYAALAVGRVGTKDFYLPMAQAMTVRQTGLNTKRSAAIALGQLGRRVDGDDRKELATKLVKAYEEAKDDSTKNFAIISMAYVLQADIEAKRTDVLGAKGPKISEVLLAIAKDGRYSQRPYGALALGLVGRSITEAPTIPEYATIREEAIKVLRDGLEEKKLDKRGRAAFAIALGILKDDYSKTRARLLEYVSDKSEDKELRGYSAVALGLIGSGSKDVENAITDAMRERTSEELRTQTAIALGLLQSKKAVEILLEEFGTADNQTIAGQAVIALAKIGDHRAIATLVKYMKDGAKPDLTKALCCAGLGLIGDLELIPSLSRISKDINYRATTDAINEVLSIL